MMQRNVLFMLSHVSGLLFVKGGIVSDQAHFGGINRMPSFVCKISVASSFDCKVFDKRDQSDSCPQSKYCRQILFRDASPLRTRTPVSSKLQAARSSALPSSPCFVLNFDGVVIRIFNHFDDIEGNLIPHLRCATKSASARP